MFCSALHSLRLQPYIKKRTWLQVQTVQLWVCVAGVNVNVLEWDRMNTWASRGCKWLTHVSVLILILVLVLVWADQSQIPFCLGNLNVWLDPDPDPIWPELSQKVLRENLEGGGVWPGTWHQWRRPLNINPALATNLKLLHRVGLVADELTVRF